MRRNGSVMLAVWMLGAAVAGADLDVTVSVDKPAVAVGEEVAVTVAVKNKGVKAAPAREIRFGKEGLDFDLVIGKGKAFGDAGLAFRFTRVNGSVYQPEKPKETEIGPGQTLSATVKIPALVAGKMTIVGVLWGRVQLDTLTVDVLGEDKEIRWVIDTDQGKMVGRLLPELAPNTVANLVQLARSGFYNGLSFHRIGKGFMIQGGCPTGDGMGGPGFTLPAEFTQKRKHVRGILSMARSQHPDSAGSQFFVMDGEARHLDGQYTIFGEIVLGLDVLDKIVALPVRPNAAGENSDPLKKPAIKSIAVEVAAKAAGR